MAKKKTSVIQVMITGDSKDLQQATGAASGALYGLLNVAASLASGVGAALAASVTAAAGFESAFAGVRKTVDATEAEFQMLSDGIREMSRRMPQSAVEIAGVAEAAGQLGIKTDAILGFTETMIMLGDTTDLVSSEAATGFAQLAAITQMPQDQFDELGSVIVELGNSFAATESQILDFSLRVAGAGSTVGLSEGEIMAFSAAMANVGLEAEAGGSAMSRFFLRLSSDVATGNSSIQEFASVAGMSAQEFTTLFETDAADAVAKFIEGLGKLEGSQGVLALERLNITGIRDRDTLLRLAGSAGELQRALDLQGTAFSENSALTEEARERYKTFVSQLQIAKNNVVDLGISIGNVLLPYLGQMISSFMDAMPAIRTFVDGALPKLDELAAGVTTFVQDKLVPGFQDMFKNLDESTMITNLRETLLSIIEGAIPIASDLTTIARQFISEMALALEEGDPKAIGQALGNLFGRVFSETLDILALLGGALNAAIAKQGGWFEVGFKAAKFLSLFLVGLAAGLFSTENLNAVMSTALDPDNFGRILIAALSLSALPAKIFGALITALRAFPIVGRLLAYFLTIFRGLGDKLLYPIKTAFSSVGTGIAVGITKFGDDAVANLRRGVSGPLDDWGREVTAWGGNMWTTTFARMGERIGIGLSGLKGRFVQWFDETVTTFTSWLPRWSELGDGIIGGILKGISTNAWKIIKRLKDLALDALSAAKKKLGIESPSKEFALVGMDMMRGMALGIDKSSGIVIEALEGVANQSIGANMSIPNVPVGANRNQAPIVVNVSGAIDPEGTARTIIRVLEDAQRRTGARLVL